MNAYETLPQDCIVAYYSGHSEPPRGKAAYALTIRRIVRGKTVKCWEIVMKAEDSTLAEREVAALLHLLNCLRPDEPLPVIIRSDYAFTLRGATEWMANWKARDWKTSDKKPVSHAEQWMQIADRLDVLAKVRLSFQLVPPKADDARNAKVTALAKQEVAA